MAFNIIQKRDLSRSILAGSEELPDICCSLCAEIGRHTEAAVNYCTVCYEFMCDGCIKDHQKFAPNRVHKLLNQTEIRARRKSLSQSIQKGSDDVDVYLCTSCSKEGITVVAFNYCIECSVYMCVECLKQHSKFASLSLHQVVDSEIKNASGSEDIHILCTACYNGGNSIKADIFCVECDAYMCSTCLDYHKKFQPMKAHQLLKQKEKEKRARGKEIDSHTSQLEKVNADLRKTLEQQLGQNQELEGRLDEVQTVLKQTKTELDIHLRENQTVKKQQDYSAQRCADLIVELDQVKKRIIDLQKNLEQAHGNAKQQSMDDARKYELLEKEHDELKNRLHEVQTVLKQVQTGLEQTKTELDIQLRENETVKKQQEDSAQRCADLVVELDQVKKHIIDLQKKLEQAQENANQQSMDDATKYELLEKEYDELKDRLQHTETELDIQLRVNANLKVQEDNTEQQCAKLTVNFNELQRELKDTQESSKKQHYEDAAKHTSLMNERSQLTERGRTLIKEKEDIEKQLKEVTDENALLIERLKQEQNKELKLIENIENLERRLKGDTVSNNAEDSAEICIPEEIQKDEKQKLKEDIHQEYKLKCENGAVKKHKCKLEDVRSKANTATESEIIQRKTAKDEKERIKRSRPSVCFSTIPISSTDIYNTKEEKRIYEPPLSVASSFGTTHTASAFSFCSHPAEFLGSDLHSSDDKKSIKKCTDTTNTQEEERPADQPMANSENLIDIATDNHEVSDARKLEICRSFPDQRRVQEHENQPDVVAIVVSNFESYRHS